MNPHSHLVSLLQAIRGSTASVSSCAKSALFKSAPASASLQGCLPAGMGTSSTRSLLTSTQTGAQRRLHSSARSERNRSHVEANKSEARDRGSAGHRGGSKSLQRNGADSEYRRSARHTGQQASQKRDRRVSGGAKRRKGSEFYTHTKPIVSRRPSVRKREVGSQDTRVQFPAWSLARFENGRLAAFDRYTDINDIVEDWSQSKIAKDDVVVALHRCAKLMSVPNTVVKSENARGYAELIHKAINQVRQLLSEMDASGPADHRRQDVAEVSPAQVPGDIAERGVDDGDMASSPVRDDDHEFLVEDILSKRSRKRKGSISGNPETTAETHEDVTVSDEDVETSDVLSRDQENVMKTMVVLSALSSLHVNVALPDSLKRLSNAQRAFGKILDMVANRNLYHHYSAGDICYMLICSRMWDLRPSAEFFWNATPIIEHGFHSLSLSAVHQLVDVLRKFRCHPLPILRSLEEFVPDHIDELGPSELSSFAYACAHLPHMHSYNVMSMLMQRSEAVLEDFKPFEIGLMMNSYGRAYHVFHSGGVDEEVSHMHLDNINDIVTERYDAFPPFNKAAIAYSFSTLHHRADGFFVALSADIANMSMKRLMETHPHVNLSKIVTAYRKLKLYTTDPSASTDTLLGLGLGAHSNATTEILTEDNQEAMPNDEVERHAIALNHILDCIIPQVKEMPEPAHVIYCGCFGDMATDGHVDVQRIHNLLDSTYNRYQSKFDRIQYSNLPWLAQAYSRANPDSSTDALQELLSVVNKKHAVEKFTAKRWATLLEVMSAGNIDSNSRDVIELTHKIAHSLPTRLEEIQPRDLLSFFLRFAMLHCENDEAAMILADGIVRKLVNKGLMRESTMNVLIDACDLMQWTEQREVLEIGWGNRGIAKEMVDEKDLFTVQ
eukprot:GFYU01008120.1.p1 GENE.GFYU01008120.1~~GFYU01008120.1.p1  ORF type:complete len:895 (+),score=169.17 GFYU01008120.1:221-2905(+)